MAEPTPTPALSRCLRRGMLAALCCATTALCRADSNYLIDVWTPYEGLPQSRVLSISQTPDGYLWISTQLGWLARFDGIQFEQFHPNNTPALLSPEIRKLIVNDRGTLWIGDVDGRVSTYSNGKFAIRTTPKPGYARRITEWVGRHGDENRFFTAAGMLARFGDRIVYENEDNPLLQAPTAIRQFCQDKDGSLWCRTTGGVLGRWQDASIHPVGDDELPAETRIHHLLSDPAGGIWIAANNGLWKTRNDSFTEQIQNFPDGETAIRQLARNPDGSLWLLGESHLMLARDREIVQSTALPTTEEPHIDRASELHADSTGGAWILTPGSGVWHVDPTGMLTTLSTANGLPSNLVETWFEDREKNIWLGTAAGLVRVRPRWFQTIDTNLMAQDSEVVSICEHPPGTMWFGRLNGLTRWENHSATNIPLPPVRNGFPVTEVTVAPGDSPTEVWLGTVQSGALLLRDGNYEMPFPFHAPGYAIRTIRRGPDGDIWFGGEFGLFRWNGESLRKFGPDDGLSAGHIHDISFDEQGVPWVTKADDLLVTYRDGRFQSVPLPGLSGSLRIYTVLCGRDGNVWLGTVGAGLIHLSRGKLLRYTKADGLPADSVSQLLEDDDGFLWGGTIRGIFRVSTTALDMRSKGVQTSTLFQNYDHSDGLPTSECTGGLQPACWKAGDGRLWFSTATGAVVVDPGQVRKNLTPPAIVIEQMRVGGNDIKITRATENHKPHEISPGRHRYEFMFTGLSLTAPEKVRFQWRLKGVDSTWVEGGTQRSVAYSGLEPGDYQFSVRARNNDGIWSKEPAVIRFHVQPSLLQRGSVRFFLGIAGLSLAYFIVTAIMRRRHERELRFLEYERSLEQQRFRHKAAMEAERSRIASELHDDLGANLTQIQWLGEAATPPGGPPAEETEIIRRITRKSREMVGLIDQIVWAVNPKNDTLEQLVTYVCNFAEQYFRDSTTRCRIDVADDIPAFELKADVRHHLFLIAKEALHNVAKHAATDRVWIRVTCNESLFHLAIKDNGRGFDPQSSAARGDGLQNMQNRAKQAGADLDIQSDLTGGTLVTLTLKLDPPSA